MKHIIFFLFVMLSVKAHSFPDLVRHGYTTCITCHMSPSGGGVLTSYGKFVAGELFGAWNSSDDALPWLVKPEEDAKFVASILMRGAQTYLDSPEITIGDFKKMQMDLETGLVNGPWAAIFSAGLRGSSATGTQKETDLKTRTFYVSHATTSHSIRVGRFMPEYGLKHPNHNIPTRKGLYWSQGDEPYVVQTSLYTQTWDYNIGYLQGANDTQLEDKKGYVGSFVYKTSNTRSGVSILDMKGDGKSTNSRSVFTQLGYFDNGYTLAEYALKSSDSGVSVTNKRLLFVESGWEVRKGFIPYIGYQSTEVEGKVNHTSSTPIGMRFYPFTHGEIIFEYQPVVSQTPTGKSKATWGFVMFNLYF